jgi:hypothetical protein
MGIGDSLFGSKKGPARGRASLDDDEGARRDFTRAIPREEIAQKRAPVDDWDPAPARPPAPPEVREEIPPMRRSALLPPRAYSPRASCACAAASTGSDRRRTTRS